jgi:hypothetical protein
LAGFLCFILLSLNAGGLSSISSKALTQVPGPDQYTLTFTPRPGQTLVYNLQSGMNAEGKGFIGRSLSMNSQASGEIDLAVAQVSADQVFTDLSSPGIRVSLLALGRQDEFTLEASPDDPVRVIFDKAGRIRDVQNVEALEEQNRMNFSILEVLRNFLPSYPDRALAVGDSWKDHKRMMVPFEGMNLTIEAEVAFTLDGVAPSAQGRLGFVSAAYSVKISGARSLESASGIFEGQGTGSGNLNLLIDAGYFTDYRLDYSVDGSMTIRQGEVNLAAWPFKLVVNTSLTLLESRYK